MMIDPRIVAKSSREREVLEAISARGLDLHKLHASGDAVRLTGPGVYLVAASLAGITLADLAPASDADARRQVALLIPRRQT